MEGLRTLCIAKRVSGAAARRARSRGLCALPGAVPAACAHRSLRRRSAGRLAQVLSQEEYACWLKGHLEAESSVDNREELLFQSAIRLETGLHLLGKDRHSECVLCGRGVSV